MKNFISGIIAITLCVGFTACGPSNIKEEEENTSTTTTTTTATTQDKSYSSDYSKSNSNGYSSGNNDKSDNGLSDGKYYCMGKNDTCKNKTSSPTDLYCYSCDPDNNNIEGDQSKSYGSGGKVIDNDYDNDIDTDDWEKAWGDYLDDKYDEYGY